MADIFTQQKRSEVMARIRSRGNRDTELALAVVLRAHGLTGWRRHHEIRSKVTRSRTAKIGAAQQRRPTGIFRVRPDFVFRRERVAVFVDGCFWHGCPRHGTQPRGNAAFWRRKLAGNRERDRRVTRTLRRLGWRVVRIWEHELHRRQPARVAAKIRRALKIG